MASKGRRSTGTEADYRRKLGLEFNAIFSFIFGNSYPVPLWFGSLKQWHKTLWYVYRRVEDVLTVFLFISNSILIVESYRDIRVLSTTAGTVSYIATLACKILTFERHSKMMDEIFENMCRISSKLDRNPMQNDDFFRIHGRYMKLVRLYGLGKNSAIIGGVFMLTFIKFVQGISTDIEEERVLPMAGWFPYNWKRMSFFVASCILQFFAYLPFLVKNVAVDLLFLTILICFNTCLIHLRTLLKLMAEDVKNGRSNKSNRMRKNLIWWINQYQWVLRTVEDFKDISSAYLLVDYINVVITLFLGGVLVTSNVVYDTLQQMVIISITSSNLLQLYIFSFMGDKITENGLRIAEGGFNINMLNHTKDIKRLYSYTLARSKKPLVIRFGIINQLSVFSFGKIVKMSFSYFTTIVQMRTKSVT